MPRNSRGRAALAAESDAPPAPSPSAPRLDEVDSRLLALLIEDGRRSYADLAHEVGLSAPSVYARVTFSSGSFSTSAANWARVVSEPWPISTVLL
jgi:AsnC-type helix-turn-helix domain